MSKRTADESGTICVGEFMICDCNFCKARENAARFQRKHSALKLQCGTIELTGDVWLDPKNPLAPLVGLFTEKANEVVSRAVENLKCRRLGMYCCFDSSFRGCLKAKSPVEAVHAAYDFYSDQLKHMEERLARLQQADTCEAFIKFYETALAFERELQRLATSTKMYRTYTYNVDGQRQFHRERLSELCEEIIPEYFLSYLQGNHERMEKFTTRLDTLQKFQIRNSADLRKSKQNVWNSDALYDRSNKILSLRSNLHLNTFHVQREIAESGNRIYSGETLSTEIGWKELKIQESLPVKVVNYPFRKLKFKPTDKSSVRLPTDRVCHTVLNCFNSNNEQVGYLDIPLGDTIKFLIRRFGVTKIGCRCTVDLKYRFVPALSSPPVSVMVDIYVARDDNVAIETMVRDTVGEFLAVQKDVKLIQPPSTNVEELLVNEQKVIADLREKTVQDFDTMLENLQTLPKDNTDFLYTPLNMITNFRPHQKSGLSWMLSVERGTANPLQAQEKRDDKVLPLFWTKVESKIREPFYYNYLVRAELPETDKIQRGGILGDDMGLGKTLLCLALVAGDRHGYFDVESKKEEQVKLETEHQPKTETVEHTSAKIRNSAIPVKQEEADSSDDCVIVSVVEAPKKRWRPRPRPHAGQQRLRLSSSESSDSDEPPQNDNMAVAKTETVPKTEVVTEGQDSLGVASQPREKRGPTLVVAPLGVMSNWAHQIGTHFRTNSISFLKYHGPTRHYMSNQKLEKCDVVITCYSTLGTDYNDAKGQKLFAINWHRVILDEAHYIKCPKTAQSKACCALKAKLRWFVTGTPVQNKMQDLYAALKFLRVQPLDQPLEFRTRIERPFESDRCSAKDVQRIRNLITPLMLRRTKGDSLKTVPKRRIIKKRINFNSTEWDCYNALRRSEQVHLRGLGIHLEAEERALLLSYLSIIGSVMKLRKCCDSYKMVESHIQEMKELKEKVNLRGATAVATVGAAGDQLTSEQKTRLQELLQIIFNDSPDAVCPVCHRKHEETKIAISECCHAACYKCLQTIIKMRGNCPTCCLKLKPGCVVRLPKPKLAWLFEPDSDETVTENRMKVDLLEPFTDRSLWSSKLVTIAKLVEAHFKDPENGKIVIVSQFLDFLAEIGSKLKALSDHEGYRLMSFNGSITEVKRTATLDKFENSDSSSKDILLLAMISGSVGLNLTAANLMIICEPNYNPGREAQCQDRIYRIGQTRPVTVYKLFVHGTIEKRLLEMQRAKRHIMEAVCADMAGNKKKQEEDERAQRLKDMRSILKHVFNGAESDSDSESDAEVELDELGNKITTSKEGDTS